MADKTIGSLPQATNVDDASLFVIEQQGQAMKTSGATWKGYAQAAAKEQAELAAASALSATASAAAAAQSAQDLENAVETTNENVLAAQTAQEAAETARSTAESAAASAIESKNAAQISENNAEESKQIAQSASAAAQTAQEAAETARSTAESAAASAIESKNAAQISENNAEESANSASNAKKSAESAALAAETAQQAIENLGVAGETLPAGSSVQVTKTVSEEGAVTLTFKIPQGATGGKGDPGSDVSSTQRTSGTGAAGTTDTYTMYNDDGEAVGTFTVYNGANGTGTGDFMANGTVPMTGNLQMGGNKVSGMAEPTADTDGATKGYVDTALEGVTITTDPEPTADSTNPVQSGGVYTALQGKQALLTGTTGQIVGFSDSGTATPIPMPTANDIGAVPTSRTVNGKALSSNITLTAADVGAGPGKRTARFTVGTSAAGWTASDCDYLCDGTDDQVEINAAIQALPTTGGEVVVLDGTYNITAAISVDKDNVKLSGNGAATVLKRMWNNSGSRYDGIVNIIAVNGNCDVESIFFDGNKTYFGSSYNCAINITNEQASGILLYQSNNTIRGCKIQNSFYGIRCSGMTQNNTITGNTCNNNAVGITIDNNSTNNTITGNTCNNNVNYGITIDNNSTNNTITGNTCNNNVNYGIYLVSNSTNNTITGNTCNNNDIGIAIDNNSTNNTITGNTCNNNLTGIYISGYNNTITGNTCIRGTGSSDDYATSQYTIQCYGSNNLITGNNIMGKNYVDNGTGNTWANNKYE